MILVGWLSSDLRTQGSYPSILGHHIFNMWSLRFLKESHTCFNCLNLEATSLLRTRTWLGPRELRCKTLLCQSGEHQASLSHIIIIVVAVIIINTVCWQGSNFPDVIIPPNSSLMFTVIIPGSHIWEMTNLKACFEVSREQMFITDESGEVWRFLASLRYPAQSQTR